MGKELWGRCRQKQLICPVGDDKTASPIKRGFWMEPEMVRIQGWERDLICAEGQLIMLPRRTWVQLKRLLFQSLTLCFFRKMVHWCWPLLTSRMLGFKGDHILDFICTLSDWQKVVWLSFRFCWVGLGGGLRSPFLTTPQVGWCADSQTGHSKDFGAT